MNKMRRNRHKLIKTKQYKANKKIKIIMLQKTK